LIQEFVGKTKTQKLIDEIGNIYQENLHKKFPQYFEKQSVKSFAIVTALKNNEIKNLGMSIVDDLLLDSYGQFIGGLFLTDTSKVNVLKDTAGSLQTCRWYGNGNNQRTFNFTDVTNSTGMLIKTGTGNNVPNRGDFNLQTLTKTHVSSNGGYNSGLGRVQMPASSVSTLNETIAEAGLFGQWNMGSGNSVLNRNIMLSRDLISPTVQVLIGETINVDYQLILS